MKLENLSDKDLARIAINIEKENKVRANRKAAAAAIRAVLKKHRLSIDDISQLGLDSRPSKAKSKRAIPTKTKAASAKKTDRRVNVAFKYKNPKGSDKWSGRGRTPKWVTAILETHNMSIAQFKADKRYKI